MSEEKVDKEEEKVDKEKEQAKRVLTCEETVAFAFSILAEKAWVSLGMIKDTDGEFHKSKEGAKFLIDTLSNMSETFESHFEKEVLKDMKNQIATLKLNFVNQFKN